MPKSFRRAIAVLALTLAVLPSPAAPAAPGASTTAASKPKLLVVLVVDQMRADYVAWYGGNWKGGLHRLFTKGAYYRQARYPYLETITCAGHATIGTGAYPHTHGMMQNVWLDRAQGKEVECTADPTTPLVGAMQGHPGTGDSAKNLMVHTLGDEMQAQLQPPARVIGLSMKARSAINISGHKPDLVLWFEEGTWVTSKAFAAAPAPWLVPFLTAHPMSALVQAPWTPLLPAAAYKNQDDAVGEHAEGWTNVFPHDLKGSRPGSLGRLTMSPMADDYLAQLALGAVTAMKLGQGATTDLLALSFSMTDSIGHHFGPRSHEVQDTLARLDALLATFFTALDQAVGADNYVVALSADHGVAEIPEQMQGPGKDGGRILEAALADHLNTAIAKDLGPGRHVIGQVGSEIYLAPGVYDRLRAKPGAVARALAALRAFPGIADAVDAAAISDLAAKPAAKIKTAKPTLLQAAALSYFPGRSGDLLILTKPNWIVGQSLATTHGSTHDYDQRVPLVFLGPGIKAGVFDRAASPADLAPTLAALIGVTLKDAEGVALPEITARGRRFTRSSEPADAKRP
jgi:predicted AlkP superfamily pyrophosphatase or phosphodiesterase